MRRRSLYLNGLLDSIEATFIGSSTVADSYSLVRTIEVSPDGQFIYVTSRTPAMIRQFEVTNPLDITQGVTEIAAVSCPVSDPRFLRFSPDGTKLFFGITSLIRWNLSTAWDITTFSQVQTLSGTGTFYGGSFSEDGTRLFLCGSDSVLRQRNLSTAWDLTTTSLQGATLTSNEDFLFFGNGSIGVNLDSNPTTGKYNIYKFATPYELNTATLSESKDFLGGISAKSSLAIAKAKNINRFYNGIMNQGSYNLIKL